MQDDSRRRDVMRRLTNTRRGETICLMYWEVAVLLDYIRELKWGCKDAQDSGGETVPVLRVNKR